MGVLMDRERRRLDRLEEEASQRRPATGERSRPSDHDEERALDQGMAEWRALMTRHGWTTEEIDAEVAWVSTVNRRCRESGPMDFQVMSDMISFFQAGGEWDDYPGPGYWQGGGRGSANGPMPVQ
jgi:hypothetical protein